VRRHRLMNKPIAIYLRTYRKRFCLTQSEVARLLGLESGQVVSRYERLDRSPSLETVLGCQVLFNVMPHELYPGLYQKVENLTRQRVHALIGQIGEDFDDGALTYKRDVLVQIIERIGSPAAIL
jgi:transcriptional regulator with XRE-family HTH domain